MTAKTFEVRDRGTCAPVLAIRLDPGNDADAFLLGRAGFGRKASDQRGYILLHDLVGNKISYDPYSWSSDTFRDAHDYILANFDVLESGAVICTESLRGEIPTPRVSDHFA